MAEVPEQPQGAYDRPTELTYSPNVTDAEKRTQERQERLEEENSPSVWEGIEASVQNDWSTTFTYDAVMAQFNENKELAPDPDYKLTEGAIREEMGDVPSKYWDYVDDSVSEADFKAKAKKARDDWSREQELGELGATGTAIRLGVSMLDPQAWAIGAAAGSVTGGTGLAAVAAGKISKARNILRSAGIGAGVNAATEGQLALQKPVYDNENVIYSTFIGAGIGGAFGALGKSPATAREHEELQEIVKRNHREIETGDIADSAGAMRNSRRQEALDEDDILDEFDETVDAPETAFGNYRFDLAAVGGRSKNPYTRAIYNNMVENTVGYKDKSITSAIGASERQARLQRQKEIEWRRSYEPSFTAYHKEKHGGTKWLRKTDDRAEFNEAIADYVRGYEKNPSPHVKKAGDALRASLDDYRQRANDPSAYRGEQSDVTVSRDGELESNPNYLPREYDLRKIDELVEEFGDTGLKRFFSRSFQSDAKKRGHVLEDADALRAADKYLKALRKLTLVSSGDSARVLEIGDQSEVRRTLTRETDMDSSEIDDLIDALSMKDKKTGTVANMKERIRLDENYTARMKQSPEFGADSRQLSFKEFLNNDVEDLFQKYNRRMSGALSMAEVKVPGVTDGIRNTGQLEKVKDTIAKKSKDMRLADDATKKELEGLDFLYDSVMGIPKKGDSSAYAQSLKMFRDFNFSRLMGQVGLAQIPEFGVVGSSVGFKTMLQSMPTFRTLWRNAQDGKLSDELADELELYTGIGGDWLNGKVIQRWNETTGAPDTFLGNSPKMQRIEQFNHRAKRAVYASSGMSVVNTTLQRWSLNAIAHKFDNMASGKKRISEARLRHIGLSEQHVEDVFDQIRTHATRDSRGRLKRMNFENWDMGTSARFQNAMYKMSRRMVQENDVGQFREWMSKPTAQTLLQFRSFIIGAYTKNLLHNLHMRDFETFASFTSQTFLAGLTYIGQTHLKAQGREDRNEYLDERLGIANVAKAAFSRAGYASLLPTGWDTAAKMVGMENQFAYRSSGQAQDLLIGNPTGDLFDKLESVTSGIGDSVIKGRSFSQQELRDGLSLLPMQNVMGITQMFNLLLKESGLPPSAPRD